MIEKGATISDYLLIQISDAHLTGSGTLFAGVRPRDNLVAGLSYLADSGVEPDAIILTGDLADAGEEACYEDLADVLATASFAADAEVIFVPGNHDQRPAFRKYLLNQAPNGEPVNQIHWRRGLRIISLDSSVPGHVAGHLSDHTLSFLRDALREPAADGTVVALHHPPIPSPIGPMAEVMLENPHALSDVIGGTDVRLVLCGHNHHEGSGALASIPVWASPSIAYRSNVLNRRSYEPMIGSALSVINLSDTGTTVGVAPIPPA